MKRIISIVLSLLIDVTMTLNPKPSGIGSSVSGKVYGA